MSENTLSRSDFWNERAKHKRFLELVDLVEKNNNAAAIYAVSGLEPRLAGEYGRQVVDIASGYAVWTEAINFGTRVEAYERFAKAYNAHANDSACSRK